MQLQPVSTLLYFREMTKVSKNKQQFVYIKLQ